MAKQVIRNIRGGSAKVNEEDRVKLAELLAKFGYTVRIAYRTVPGDENKPKPKKEYVIEYSED